MGTLRRARLTGCCRGRLLGVIRVVGLLRLGWRVSLGSPSVLKTKITIRQKPSDKTYTKPDYKYNPNKPNKQTNEPPSTEISKALQTP